MKSILIFGDSITWGSDPASGARHSFAVRWPNVMGTELEGKARIVCDALRGRTTGYDEHLADCDRNGVRLLPTALYAHAPVDLVILLLGVNDMKPHICGTALGAMQGMRRLVQIVNNHMQGMNPPKRAKVLLVSPPALVETENVEFAAMFDGGVAESQKLAAFYEKLAKEMGVAFFDAGSVAVASPIDGVHLDADNTKAIGMALAPVVAELLEA